MDCIGCGTPIPPGANQCPMCTAPVNSLKPTFGDPLPTVTGTPTAVDHPKTKICPKCAMKIPAAAVKCPHCRTTVGMSFLGKIIAVLFIGMVGSCVIGKAIAPKDQHKPPLTAQEIESNRLENIKNDVKYNAKRYVELALKSPSTAKFPYYGDFFASQTPENKDVWEVTGYVDAQNSFGAMLRNTWYVKIQVSGDKYYLVDFKMPYP